MAISNEQRAIYLDACPIFGRENGDVSGDIGFEAGSEECVSCSQTTPKMCSACMKDCGVEVKTKTVKSERKMQESVEEIAELNEDTPPEDENAQTEETVETPTDVVASLETNDQTENVVVDSSEADSSLDSESETVKPKKKRSQIEALADALKAGGGTTKELAAIMVAECGGSPGSAISTISTTMRLAVAIGAVVKTGKSYTLTEG